MAPVAVAGLYPFPGGAPAAGSSLLETGVYPSPGDLPAEGRDLNAMSALPLPELLAGEPGIAETGIAQPGHRAIQTVSAGPVDRVAPLRKEKIHFAVPAAVEIQPGKEAPFNLAGAPPSEDAGTPEVLPGAGRPGAELRRSQGIFGFDLAPADLIPEHAPGRPVSGTIQGNGAPGVVNASAGSNPTPSGLFEAVPSGMFSEIDPFPAPVRHPDALRERVILQTAREVHIGPGDTQGVASAPVSRAPESIFATPGEVAISQPSGSIRDGKGAVPGSAAVSTGRNPAMRLLGQKTAGGIAAASGPHPSGISVEGTAGGPPRHPLGVSLAGANGASQKPDPVSQLRVAPAPSRQIHSAGDLRSGRFGAASLDDLHGADIRKQNPDRPAFRETLPAGIRSAFAPQVSRPTLPVAPGMVVNPPVFQPISSQINPAAGAFLLKETQTAPFVKPGTVIRYALLPEEPSQPPVFGKAASGAMFGEHPVAASPDSRTASEEAAHSSPGKETPPPGQKASTNGPAAPQGAPSAPGTAPLFHAAAVRALGADPHPLRQQQPAAAVTDEDGAAGALPQAERISETGKTFAASSAKVEQSPVPGTISRPVPGIAPANPEPRPAQGSRSHFRKAVPVFAEDTTPGLRAEGGARTVREPLSQQHGSFFAGPGGDEEAVILPISGEEAPGGTEAVTGGSKTPTPLPAEGSGTPSGKLPVVTFRNASQFTGRLAVFFQEQFNQLARHSNSAGAHLMLQLEPRELGVIRLKLRMKNNRLVGEIETGLAETSTLLHQNQGQLISRLHEMGVQIQDFQIVHNENMADQQQFAREQQPRHGQSGGAGNRAKDSHKADLSPDPVLPHVAAGRIDVMV